MWAAPKYSRSSMINEEAGWPSEWSARLYASRKTNAAATNNQTIGSRSTKVFGVADRSAGLVSCLRLLGALNLVPGGLAAASPLPTPVQCGIVKILKRGRGC